MGPDKVCAKYAGEGKVPTKNRLTVQIMGTEDGQKADLILIEGEAKALAFLGKLLIAQAGFEKDCSFFLGPRTAGNAFFTKKSTHGFYIHRLPCLDETGNPHTIAQP